MIPYRVQLWMASRFLIFYWTDRIDAMKRSVAKLQYRDKLYTSFNAGKSILVPNVRAFDEANTGMIFQGSFLLDTGSAPLLALFYADASFSGASVSHHPIYNKSLFWLYVLYILFKLYSLFCSVFAQLA
jgi:hypothetical protein